MPRFRVACKNEMATNQSPTVRPTTFPEDIEVGKDGAGVEVVSSEIPMGGKGAARRITFAGGQTETVRLPQFSLVAS